MGILERKERERERRRQQIIVAAKKVFSEKGFNKATMDDIAGEAELSPGTLYLYFKNKEDIMVNFFGYKTKQVFGRFREEVDKADNARDKLRLLIKRHLEEFQRDRNMAVLYQTETRRFSRMCEEQIREMSKMYLDLVSEIVENGQDEGLMRKDLYMGLVKRFIIGAIDEVINTWLHSGSSYDLVSMADPLVDLFIRGVGNPEVVNR